MTEKQMFENTDPQDSGFFLTAAREALGAGQARLAIHLYCAAFELDTNQGQAAGEDVLNGLRVAWNLACEMGDRSTAESLLNELEPFNSQEQNAHDLLRLQGLAIGQLEAIGISGDGIKGMAGIMAEALGGADREGLMDAIRSALDAGGLQLPEDDSDVQDMLMAAVAVGSQDPDKADGENLQAVTERVELPPKPQNDEGGWRLDYSHIVGFRLAMQKMKEFGFFAQDDEAERRFAERMANLHGVYPLALSEPFLFIGPDSGDLEFFAEATANEIGNPVLHIKADMDELGNGSIKLAGPFRHRLFGGPPDLSDLQTPCTVMLTGLDRLQQIFHHSKRVANSEAQHGSPPWESGQRRNIHIEFGAYLRELLSRPGVFLIATAEDGYQVSDMILDIVGIMHEIRVDNPDADERRAVWERFRLGHASFSHLEMDDLVKFSAGLPRNLLFGCAQDAIYAAYRASLRQGNFQEVRMSDILNRLSIFVDRESDDYKQMEDAAVREFGKELDDEKLF
ncbi:MAG: hypothetical protein FWF71_07305 [Actinomycetia bacterium]|nr:hypothetical protein [Actinomycetes bacterium]